VPFRSAFSGAKCFSHSSRSSPASQSATGNDQARPKGRGIQVGPGLRTRNATISAPRDVTRGVFSCPRILPLQNSAHRRKIPPPPPLNRRTHPLISHGTHGSV
jgi:hypothetical protein